ncbi:MAG: GAF domain-containing protein [Chloroflexi bacterium]|nr:GAF domain-containing protein [Chloroflexota bacterium]
MNEEKLVHRAIRAFYNIAKAMNASYGRQELLQRMLETIVRELGYKAASIRLLDQERQTLEMEAAVGLSERYLAKGPVEVAHSPIDREVLRGNAVALHDIVHDGGLQYPDEARAEGIRSVLAVPLRIQDRNLGVLRVYTAEPHHFTQDEQLLVGAVANLAARAIRNAHLYRAMHTIASEVNSSLKLNEVLKALLRNVIEEVNCKAASIRLLGPRKRRLHLVAAEGLSERYLKKGDIWIKESPIDREVLQGKPAMIYDVEREVGFQYPEEAAREGIRSVLAVPLKVQDQIIGVLRAYSAQPHRFSEEEVEFLEAIADLGAIAIENARLHEALNERYEAAREDWAGWYRFLTLS